MFNPMVLYIPKTPSKHVPLNLYKKLEKGLSLYEFVMHSKRQCLVFPIKFCVALRTESSVRLSSPATLKEKPQMFKGIYLKYQKWNSSTTWTWTWTYSCVSFSILHQTKVMLCPKFSFKDIYFIGTVYNKKVEIWGSHKKLLHIFSIWKSMWLIF